MEMSRPRTTAWSTSACKVTMECIGNGHFPRKQSSCPHPLLSLHYRAPLLQKHRLPISAHITASMQTTANTSKPLSDIRTWSLSERREKLAKGTRIQVSDYKGRNVIEMPLPLLQECSFKMVARIENNKITLPASVDGPTATKLLNHILYLTTSHSTIRMSLSFDHIENLKLCTVAEILGVSLYM